VTGEEIVVTVIDALTALRVPYMVSGSLASNFYGVPRSTQDADLVLELSALPLEAFAARIGPGLQVDEQLAFETVTGARRLLVRARDAAFQVELFGVTDDPHDRERFARRRIVAAFDRQVALPTAEDVVITKLRWADRAGRRKDLDDARNVLAVQREHLDRPYVMKWCASLGLVAIFEELERSIDRR
jgi:hypothetical protein